MRRIFKGVEPHLLKAYRGNPKAVYDGPKFTVVKDEVRKQLVLEQGYLCAYCMQRIYNDQFQTKIEHWHCQDNYSSEQLNYSNLLAVCKGNEGNPKAFQHCDTFKANSNLKFNPSIASHCSQMKLLYGSDGSISSADKTFSEQLEQVLNLNLKRIKDNRASVIDSVSQVLNSNAGSRTAAEIRKFIASWQQKDAGGALAEYCEVAIFYLNKRLAKTKS